VLHFAETEGAPRDQTGYAHAVQSNAAPNAEGLIGAGAGFKGGERVTIGPAPTLKIGPTGGFTFTAWVKPAEAGQTAELFAQKDGAKSVVVGLDKGRVYASVSGQGPAVSTPRAELAPGVWSHVAVTASDQLTLYVNGQPAGASPVKLPELEGTVTLGAGFSGELDEVTLSNVARATGWIGALAAGQGAEQKLVTYGEAEGGESGGSSYLSILLGAVTLDGWVVIGILMVMMVISVWVMISKALTVVRTDKANEVFLERFRASGGDLTSLAKQLPGAVPNGTGKAHASAIAQSSLLPLYSAGIRELDVRLEAFRAKGATASLSAQSINAIRATLDAGYVRLTHKLNSQMVLLTIAISGGPFLGLLGTVVGVMITFAAIAAAGDVNVNAIAPGIAAALVATVAGLAVAIPALFGYNYLASRIKNINADMQVFCDEFVTRLAEQYS
jgi:biopolymer transport protein ExbB